jgi:hypothetical protein
LTNKICGDEAYSLQPLWHFSQCLYPFCVDSIYQQLLFWVVWAFLIFNLDRFIVSTIRKRDQFGAIFYKPHRIILALIIAIVI